MGNRILTLARKYNIIPFVIFLFIIKIFWMNKYADDIFFRRTELYEFLEVLSYIGFTAIFTVNIIACKYKSITGRNLIIDRFRYGRTYHELLNYFKDSNPHAMDLQDLPHKNWQESDGIILGKTKKQLISIPPSAGKNIAMFGIPKSGKTVTLISTCRQYKGSIFAIDIKGDIFKNTHDVRNIKVFAPADPEKSMLYDPLHGIHKMNTEEKKRFLTSIAMLLLPDQYNSTDGQYFVKGARSFFIGISLFLADELPIYDFPMLVSSILTRDAISYVKEIKSSDNIAAQSYTNSFYGENPKNVSGCYAALCEALRPFNNDNLTELMSAVNFDSSKEYITPETLEKGQDVYLQIKQSELEIYAPVLALITQQFINTFKNREEGSPHPILMVLDEFPQLKKMDGIQTALATLRSKNVTLILAMQSIAQLDKWYGESGRKEIIDCCATMLFFKIQDTNTRKWASEFIGTQKTFKIANKASWLHHKNKDIENNISENRELIFQPEDFGDLGEGKVLISDEGKYVLADIVKYYEDI